MAGYKHFCDKADVKSHVDLNQCIVSGSISMLSVIVVHNAVTEKVGWSLEVVKKHRYQIDFRGKVEQSIQNCTLL